MIIKELEIPFMEYKTYVRIVGTEYKKTPLIMLHGGPGSTHNSFEILDELSRIDERPIIMYDQLGCGKSSINDERKDLWNKETWVKELENLIQYLNIDKYHLLGHSWGGMLEIIYMCDKKRTNVKSLTLSSTLASASLWRSECERLIKLMPENEKNALLEGIKNNDFTNPNYIEADKSYTKRYVFDINPNRVKTKSSIESYITAWGPSEYNPQGTLKNYEYLDKLSNIDVPVLLLNGGNDESTPYQNKEMYDRITSKKTWYIFQNSRHRTYEEQKEKYIKLLINHLNNND